MAARHILLLLSVYPDQECVLCHRLVVPLVNTSRQVSLIQQLQNQLVMCKGNSYATQVVMRDV